MDKTNMKDTVEQLSKEIDFAKQRYQLAMTTTMGPIRLNFFPDSAPGHCRNMIALAKAGFYDGLSFHRVIPGFVIQGGCPRGNGTGGPGFQIKAEFNERKHVLGTLSMARAQSPDSAGSQFFLCLGNVPYLNGQYTVFGEAADPESIATIEKIGAVETGAGDVPVRDMRIDKATVEMSAI